MIDTFTKNYNKSVKHFFLRNINKLLEILIYTIFISPAIYNLNRLLILLIIILKTINTIYQQVFKNYLELR